MNVRGELFAAGLACSLLFVTRVAVAQDRNVEGGRAAFEAADFDTALRVFERTASAPDATREALLDAHRYLASLHIALGQSAAAALDADAALAIDPVAAPPPGAPPGAAELFDHTRAARNGERAGAFVELPARIEPDVAQSARAVARGLPRGAGWRVTVVCQSASVRVGSVEFTPEASTAEEPVALAAVRPGATVECTATITTPQGATVRRESASREVDGGAIVSAPIAETPTRHRSSGWFWPGVAIGGSAAAVALAVVITVVATSGSPSAQTRLGAPTIEP